MTTQVPNTLEINGAPYLVIDASNGPLFEVTQHGFVPTRRSTACYRGFICKYTVANERLTLQDLEISHDRKDVVTGEWEPLPEFHGVRARLDYGQDADRGYQDCDGLYEGLGFPLPYTGSVLVSRNSHGEYEPRFRGCVRAWDYDTSLLICVANGFVHEVRDCSTKIRTFIERYLTDDWADQRRNARRFLARQFGRGFSLYPSGA